MSFLIVCEEDIKRGLTTDKYFVWTERILREKGVNPVVVAEVTTSRWGIFAGLDDVLKLMDGIPVNLYAMPEGTLFFPHEPVITIVGRYLDFAKFETPLLGFICHASGVATNAFRAKLAAGDKKVFSFGTRRQHPSLSAMLERAAYIGGVDGVSNFAAEKYLDIDSIGTMPHSLIISFGSQIDAWNAFDEVVDEGVPRTMLVDTYFDEKTEAIMAVENARRVNGVRIDTPDSRRGNIRKIIEEIKWELYIRGREDVRIVLSGGLDIDDVYNLNDIVDAFGVGTFISAAKPVDFALDIVEKEGKPVAKRGKKGGMKQVFRDKKTLMDEVRLFGDKVDGKEPVIDKYIDGGIVIKKSDMKGARKLVLSQIDVIRKSDRIEDFIFNF
jgi:nicotinate phosphoribosyltransferase